MSKVKPQAANNKSSKTQPKESDGGTASVVKALRILDVFRDGELFLGVSEIARRAEIPVSTAYRLLTYLCEAGYINKAGSQYHLGNRLFALGNQVPLCQPKGLREQIGPFLGELYNATGLTVKLGILEGTDVIILDKIVGLQSAPAPTAVGGRLPANCTSLGKALLAFQPRSADGGFPNQRLVRRTRFSVADPTTLEKQLDHIRATGLGYGTEEAVIGQTCVAAPVLKHGQAVAAISLSAKPADPTLSKSIQHLLSTVRRIERKINI